jgi:hypothetical protein
MVRGLVAYWRRQRLAGMRDVSAAFLDAIVESYRVATRIDVLVNGIVEETITDAVEGTVTLDLTAQVRGRLDLSIVDDGSLGLVPTSASDLLTPYGNELQVYRGIRYPNGVDELVSLGVFRMDDVKVDDDPNGLLIRIAGLDRAQRVIDARFEDAYQVAAGTNYATAIANTLQAAWVDIPLDLAATTLTTPQLIAEEQGDRWAFCQEMAASIGYRLYFDGDGVAVTRPVTATGDSPTTMIAEGDHGVLISAARGWGRQGTYNRVIATGENTGETAPARGVATDDNSASPTYYFGPYGKVPMFYVSQFIVTDAQAADAAASLLSKQLGTTQTVDFGSLVNPALEPDDLATIIRARAGIDEQHIIDSLTIPLNADGTMTGSTRAVVS